MSSNVQSMAGTQLSPMADLANDESEQAKATMLVTAFVFLGIKGASLWSRQARERRDPGLAPVSDFLIVTR